MVNLVLFIYRKLYFKNRYVLLFLFSVVAISTVSAQQTDEDELIITAPIDSIEIKYERYFLKKNFVEQIGAIIKNKASDFSTYLYVGDSVCFIYGNSILNNVIDNCDKLNDYNLGFDIINNKLVYILVSKNRKLTIQKDSNIVLVRKHYDFCESSWAFINNYMVNLKNTRLTDIFQGATFSKSVNTPGVSK